MKSVLSIFSAVIIGLFLNISCASAQDCKTQIKAKLVCDELNILGKSKIQSIEEYHKALLDEYDIDLRVVVSGSNEDINLTAFNLFRDAEIGAFSKSRKGILLIINPVQNKVRTEISAGLDVVYTDGFVAYLQQKQMIPFFQAGRIEEGVLSTTELIVDRAQKAIRGEEFLTPENVPKNLSVGAGAKTDAHIGEGYSPQERKNSAVSAQSGMSPTQVVMAYHSVLQQGNASPDLDIYTKSTQAWKRNWVVTPAQMKTELNMYRSCGSGTENSDLTRGVAVVFYDSEQRTCAPYFLRLEDGMWKLDFVTMMKSIKFNVKNQFHMIPEEWTPYFSLLSEWRFDQNGYPFPVKKPMRWGIYIHAIKDTAHIGIIYPDTPAQTFGMQAGDYILSWDGIEMPYTAQIFKSMDNTKPGAKIAVVLYRDGKKIAVTITAPSYPE